MSWLQGEFVSTSRLEATYAGNSDLIHQMYIYGSGLRSYLLAAVVPSECESCLSCTHCISSAGKLAYSPVFHPFGREGHKWKGDWTPPPCWVVPTMCATTLIFTTRATLNCCIQCCVQWQGLSTVTLS